MFFAGWSDLVHTLVVGVGAYVGLIALLRVTGKRTLSKMNAFDFIVTVALGSTLASALLSSDVSLSRALLAFVLLCGLQYAVAFVSLRSKRFEALVKAEPTLLLYRGRILPAALRKERVTEDEILAAARGQGAGDLSSVDAVVLETDGSFSVLVGTAGGTLGALRNVQATDPVKDRAPE